MKRWQKKIEDMRHNPKGDWSIEDMKSIAGHLDITFRQPGTSHVTFRSQCGKKLTVPARKPLKAIYVKLFVSWIELVEQED